MPSEQLWPLFRTFLQAAHAGDFERFSYIIAHNAPAGILKKKLDHSHDEASIEFGIEALNAAIRANDDQEPSEGHIAIIEYLLTHGVDVNKNLPHYHVCTYPIHAAAIGGHRVIIDLLFAHGATIFTSGPERSWLLQETANNGATELLELQFQVFSELPRDEKLEHDLENALCVAASNGQIGIVQRLLDFGVSPRSQTHSQQFSGPSALAFAVRYGHHEIVALLREQGADIWNGQHASISMLIAAAEGGLTELALELLSGGANPNAIDSFDETALQCAAYRGHDDITRALVKFGAETDGSKNGQHLLFNAAAGGLNWLVKACLETEVLIDSLDSRGRSPLIAAARNGHVETMQLLFEAGIQINRAISSSKETPLQAAITAQQTAAAKWLIDHGGELHTYMIEMEMGRLTPLMNAAVMQNVEISKHLLAAGAQVSQQDPTQGNTALHHAATREKSHVTSLLLQAGAEVNTRNKAGQTPLMSAAIAGASENAALLLEVGAYLNAVDKKGNIPLHKAAENGHGPVVQLLLNAGAKRSATNQQRQTPLSLAKSEGFPRVIELLRG